MRSPRGFTSLRCWSVMPLLGALAGLGCAPLGDLDGYAKGRPDSSSPGLDVMSSQGVGAPASPAGGDRTDAGAPGGELPPLTDPTIAPTPSSAADAAPPGASGLRVSSSVPADGATGVRR